MPWLWRACLITGLVVGVELVAEAIIVPGFGVGAVGDAVGFALNARVARSKVWLGAVGANRGVLE